MRVPNLNVTFSYHSKLSMPLLINYSNISVQNNFSSLCASQSWVLISFLNHSDDLPFNVLMFARSSTLMYKSHVILILLTVSSPQSRASNDDFRALFPDELCYQSLVKQIQCGNQPTHYGDSEYRQNSFCVMSLLIQ